MAASAEPARLRVVALGDFAAASGAGKPERLTVDRDRLEAALARVRPVLHLALADPGDPKARPEPLELVFGTWRDFQPVGVAERVPWLRGWVEVRELAERLAAGEIDEAAFRSGAAARLPAPRADELVALLTGAGPTRAGTAPSRPAPEAAPESPGASAVDSLLDMVGDEGGSGGGDRARRVLEGLLPRRSDRGGPGGGAGRSAVRDLVAAIDAQLASALAAVVSRPEFRRLEETWRGLRFLVERTDFRKPVDLELLAAPLDDAPAALAALAEGEDVDFVVADYAFDASARDLERAQALAGAAQEAQTPVLAAVAPAFFGLASWRELARARAPFALFEEPAYAAWRSFRQDERARWLVLTANRVAVRAPYGPDGERSRELPFADAEGGGLFASGAWGVASVLVRAFARSGACVQVSGTRNGLIPDLALVPQPDGGRPAPVEGVFGDERREDLERVGLSVVQPYQRDIAFVGALRTFRKPERYPDAEASADAAQHVTLAYQLFASRFVKFLGRVVPQLIGTGSPDEAAGRLRDAVVAFVSTPAHELRPDHVGVQTHPNADDASITDVGLRIQPDLVIGGRTVNVMLQFSVRL